MDASQEETKPWSKVIKGAAVGLAVGTAGVCLTPTILGWAGFTAAGVTAGSLAACAQSSLYGAYTGGVFSVLQSVGAAGISAATSAGIVGGGTVVGGAGGVVVAKAGRKAAPDADPDASPDAGPDTVSGTKGPYDNLEVNQLKEMIANRTGKMPETEDRKELLDILMALDQQQRQQQ